MPRKNVNPHYRLQKASGQAVVHIDERDVYLGVYDTPGSKAKYQAIVRKARAEKAMVEMERAVQLHVDITIAELSARYMTHVED